MYSTKENNTNIKIIYGIRDYNLKSVKILRNYL